MELDIHAFYNRDKVKTGKKRKPALERRAAEEDDLCAFLQQRNIDYEGDRQLDTALTCLERYLPTLEPNDIRTIQLILSTSVYKQHSGPLSHPSGKKGHFKTAIKANRETQAIEYLRTRALTTWCTNGSFEQRWNATLE